MLHIKVVRRFVQKQDIRLFKQEFGQNDFRTLSARTFADLPIASQRIDSKSAHDLIDFRLNPVKVVCFKNFLTASGLFKQRIVHFFGIFFIILRLSFLNFKQFLESTFQKSSDRQVVRRLGILIEIADFDASLPFDSTFVR